MERTGVVWGGCSAPEGLIVQLKCLVRARVNAGRGSRNVWLGPSAHLAVLSMAEPSRVQ